MAWSQVLPWRGHGRLVRPGLLAALVSGLDGDLLFWPHLLSFGCKGFKETMFGAVMQHSHYQALHSEQQVSRPVPECCEVSVR